MSRLSVTLWRFLPVKVRRLAVWLTQSTYTVGVSAVVLDRAGRLLMLRHQLRERQGWELPGGFVRRGESLEGAIARELKEETGLDVVVTALASTWISRPRHLDVCYAARVASGDLLVDPTEVTEARFFPYTELPSDLEWDQARNIEAALERLHVTS